MSESRFYHFSSSGLFYGVSSLSEAMSSLREGGYIWLNYYDPARDEISVLTDTLGIHPLSVEDCFDEKQMPKIEHFSNNTFIIFNAFHYKDGELKTDEINIFIGSNFLITVSGHNSEGRHPLGNLDATVSSSQGWSGNIPAFLLHKVLDHIVDSKYGAFDTMENELEELEDVLLEDIEGFQPMKLIRLRRNLVSLRKSLFHEREILVRINRMDCPYVTEQALAPFRDIYDHLAKLFGLTDTYREIETSLMELYTSLLNNHMTRMSNETNTVVRRLTFITTIFMPLTLIASIFGMSEWTMITGQSNWKISYALFMAGLAVVGTVSYLLMKRFGTRSKGWEKRGDAVGE